MEEVRSEAGEHLPALDDCGPPMLLGGDCWVECCIVGGGLKKVTHQYVTHISSMYRQHRLTHTSAGAEEEDPDQARAEAEEASCEHAENP